MTNIVLLYEETLQMQSYYIIIKMVRSCYCYYTIIYTPISLIINYNYNYYLR